MAKVIDTSQLAPSGLADSQHEYWVYNGLDCCLTQEVFENMPFEPYAQWAYDYDRAMQAPALEMMLRGFPVNTELMDIMRSRIMLLRDSLKEKGYKLSEAMGKRINVASPAQVADFLYNFLSIPPVWTVDKKTKKRKVSTDRDALEKLYPYLWGRPICNITLAYRDWDKKKDLFNAGLRNGRLHTSYNVAGTETWRWSSSEDSFGGGTNLQNIEPALRIIFEAPSGKKFAYIDGEQAESRLVGGICYKLFNKPGYLDACESGDLHTQVSRLVWPNMAWTGDVKRDRKELAEQKFYRHFSYRDMAKRGGHATNYYGQPPTVAKHLKVGQDLIESFQQNYFRAFPEIREWHYWVAKQLQVDGWLDNLFGCRRHFLGRRYDDSTLREAIAFSPQSTIAVSTNLGLYRVWEAQRDYPWEVIHQNHDAIVIMYDEEKEDELLPIAKKLMEVPIPLTPDRQLIIPADAETGWNWCKFYEPGNKESDEAVGDVLQSLGIGANPNGMKRFRGHDNRTRAEMCDLRLSRMDGVN